MHTNLLREVFSEPCGTLFRNRLQLLQILDLEAGCLEIAAQNLQIRLLIDDERRARQRMDTKLVRLQILHRIPGALEITERFLRKGNPVLTVRVLCEVLWDTGIDRLEVLQEAGRIRIGIELFLHGLQTLIREHRGEQTPDDDAGEYPECPDEHRRLIRIIQNLPVKIDEAEDTAEHRAEKHDGVRHPLVVNDHRKSPFMDVMKLLSKRVARDGRPILNQLLMVLPYSIVSFSTARITA